MSSEPIDFEKLAPLVRTRMNDLDITVSQLSEELGWSRMLLSHVLSGKLSISQDRLNHLINYLGLTVDEVPIATKHTPEPKGNRVFVSYCHRDKAYLERLMVHLKPLERENMIDAWVDTKLQAGDKWKSEIEDALKNARIAVLLISADFLASDFIVQNELPPLLHAAEKQGTVIIPVVLKPCRFTRDKNLREFQSINSPDEPICTMSEDEQEFFYDNIAQRIEKIFE